MTSERKEAAEGSEKTGAEWVGTPLDVDRVHPRGIAKITVEFDEGEEVLTPQINERFGSCGLNEAARYVFFLSNHIQKGGRLDGQRSHLVARRPGKEARHERRGGPAGQPGTDPADLRPLRGR